MIDCTQATGLPRIDPKDPAQIDVYVRASYTKSKVYMKSPMKVGAPYLEVNANEAVDGLLSLDIASRKDSRPVVQKVLARYCTFYEDTLLGQFVEADKVVWLSHSDHFVQQFPYRLSTFNNRSRDDGLLIYTLFRYGVRPPHGY